MGTEAGGHGAEGAGNKRKTTLISRRNLLRGLFAAAAVAPVAALSTGEAEAQTMWMAPPSARREPMPPPRRGYTWIPGHWGWRRGAYVWVPGRWVANRPGWRYAQPRWVRRGFRWVFVPGGWVRI